MKRKFYPIAQSVLILAIIGLGVGYFQARPSTPSPLEFDPNSALELDRNFDASDQEAESRWIHIGDKEIFGPLIEVTPPPPPMK